MKKRIKAAAAVIFAVFTCIYGGMNALAMGLGTAEWAINIEYQNPPEGTVFAELLFPKKEDDRYYPDASSDTIYERDVCYNVYAEGFSSEPDRSLKLDKDCGLAKYDDGYTSCMMRRYFVKGNTAGSGSSRLDFPVPCNTDNKEVFEYYGSFKVAYCDENGNVLGVTEPVKIKPANVSCLYEIKSDGTKADYHIKKDGSANLVRIVWGLIIIVPVLIALIITLVIFLCVRPKKKQQPVERTQNNYRK